MGTQPIDRMLAKARLEHRPYPPEKLAAAEERIAARVAEPPPSRARRGTGSRDWWYRQMVPDRHALAPDEHEVLMHRVDLGLAGRESTATVRMTVLPEAAGAVVRYVPTAIEYVDDVELPLPTDGFAEHIEELAAAH
ncbi:hypothetical protein ACWDWU_30085 [Streptomyces sp. NPDC003442]